MRRNNKDLTDGNSIPEAKQSYVFDRRQTSMTSSDFDDTKYYEEEEDSVDGEDYDTINYGDENTHGYEDNDGTIYDHRGEKIYEPPETARETLGTTNNPEQHDHDGGNKRPSGLLMFAIFILLLELGCAMLAVVNYQDLVECCGDSFISTSDTTTSRWNTAIFAIGIGYLVWIIIDIPIVILSKEPVFIFNPLIGYLLAIHMLYVTNTLFAYIMYGLETFAIFGITVILMKLHRNAELCVHALFNFTLCGLVVYLIIELSMQGGYCIVDGGLESVFMESTCDISCTTDDTCNICIENVTSCFIQF